ncbi:MAG: putative toxin-antitoxin system toxin component, PIN family [Prosthecobacter sp.]|uniref:PIN domain-containing protein n=1 Tax=Prosthecobacter sp. TaxID=1965333 RepID=UPI003903003E
MAVSPAIWLEYEEVCLEMRSPGHWGKLQKLFTLVSSAHGTIIRTNPAFRFATIPADPDDNAFADCAIAAHADFVLTDDRHYRTLRNAGYKPQPIRPEEFIAKHLQP